MKIVVKFQQKNNMLVLLFFLITTTPMVLECNTGIVQAKIQWDERTQGIVAEQAIYSLPSPWKEFFMDYSEFLFLHAEGPDQYREFLKYNYMDLYNQEAPRHYDDHDTKERDGTIYNVSLPENAHLIDGKYTDEDIEFVSVNVSSSSKKYQKGVVEWVVHNFTRKITDYMSSIATDPSNATLWRQTIISMGWLAHYVADATMPLHATVNYNGELTDQGGIHDFIEYPLLDHVKTGYIDHINFSHKPAVYVNSPINQTVHSIETGLGNVSFILETDKLLAPNGIRTKDTIKDMWKILSELINARLDLAAINTANLWLTALMDSELMTSFDEEDLASLTIDTTGFDDPWMPPIPPEDDSSETTAKKTPGLGLALTILGILILYQKKSY
jgi:hypothetical protein